MLLFMDILCDFNHYLADVCVSGLSKFEVFCLKKKKKKS